MHEIALVNRKHIGPMVAGNWAIATFALISLGSWFVFRYTLAFAAMGYLGCTVYRNNVCLFAGIYVKRN